MSRKESIEKFKRFAGATFPEYGAIRHVWQTSVGTVEYGDDYMTINDIKEVLKELNSIGGTP